MWPDPSADRTELDEDSPKETQRRACRHRDGGPARRGGPAVCSGGRAVPFLTLAANGGIPALVNATADLAAQVPGSEPT